MPDSSYYNDLYNQNKNAVKSYGSNIDKLQKILDNLNDKMSDKIRNVNNEFDDLKSDMNNAIRHNSAFTTCANTITDEKEKGVTADYDLGAAVDELEAEITRIGGLKSQAESDRDYYNQKYKDKRDEERQDFWSDLKFW